MKALSDMVELRLNSGNGRMAKLIEMARVTQWQA